MNCPECNCELECMVALSADEMVSGKTERLYLCKNCKSTWSTTDENEFTTISRYFFG